MADAQRNCWVKVDFYDEEYGALCGVVQADEFERLVSGQCSSQFVHIRKACWVNYTKKGEPASVQSYEDQFDSDELWQHVDGIRRFSRLKGDPREILKNTT